MADLLRQLSKKWLETGNDRFLHELNYATHDGVYFPVMDRRIVEEYMKQRLHLHVHLFRIDDVGSVDTNICAVAEYIERASANGSENLSCGVTGEFESCVIRIDGCQGERSVLIDVHELIQYPERMEIGIALPSIVRLQALDECMRLNGNPTKSLLRDLSIKAVNGLANRELVTDVGDLVVEDDELPNNMIKRRAQIVQAFPDVNTEPEIGRRQLQAKMEDREIVRVSLGNNMALVETPFNLFPYRVEVFFGPDQFLPNTVERVIHSEQLIRFQTQLANRSLHSQIRSVMFAC